MATILPKVDAVVVGVGWTGGIISAELTRAGLKVVGLERGKERKVEDYAMIHDELRYAQRFELMQDLSKETYTFRNNQSMTALPMREYGSFLIGDGLGGAGTHWNGQTHRFLPEDFEFRSHLEKRYGTGKIPADMTIQDWGLTYEEIQPYYEKFEATAGISGPEDLGPKAPPRRAAFEGKKYPTGPMKESPMMTLFKQATQKLGYYPYICPSANLSETYDNPYGMRINKCEYCGFCERFGCEYGAKADPIVTVLPAAKQTGNFDLRTQSYVTKVLHTNGKATGVLYINTITGEEFEQPADTVVVTTYALNNVRLLLNSKLGRPYEPNTGAGVIGKNYAYQLMIPRAHAFFENKQFNTYAGAGALGMVIDDFNGDNFDHTNLNFVHGGGISVFQTGQRPIAYNPVPKGTPSWGEQWKNAVLKWQSRHVTVGAQGSSMPWKQNYLDLDPTYTDEFGMPLLRITFDFTEQDRQLASFLAGKCEEIAKAMGANIVDVAGKELSPYDIMPYQSTHNTGGVIMGANPETSAINTYSQMWDTENVFVVGASAFPHNSGYNPTATVGALAYRAAEGILKYRKQGGSLV